NDEAFLIGEGEDHIVSDLLAKRDEVRKAREAIAFKRDHVAPHLKVQDGVRTVAGSHLEDIRARAADQHVIALPPIKRGASLSGPDDVVERVSGSGNHAFAGKDQILHIVGKNDTTGKQRDDRIDTLTGTLDYAEILVPYIVGVI